MVTLALTVLTSSQGLLIAARGGHLEVLHWARANGCPWNSGTFMNAAKSGHLEVLQWLRANSCPWEEYTCAGAAEYGNLEVLQWLRANGCPWSEGRARRRRRAGTSIF
ncbi:ankyrin repeat domain-containing protein [bacterium]|nr:ankyrin repeat domain-containing protein [bacterium]